MKVKQRELLFSITKKDLTFHWFSGRGAGGQGRNKLKNCLRLTHNESGVQCTGQSNKSRVANQREAFKGILEHPKFKVWYAKKVHDALSMETVDQRVYRMMQPQNLKVETYEVQVS